MWLYQLNLTEPFSHNTQPSVSSLFPGFCSMSQTTSRVSHFLVSVCLFSLSSSIESYRLVSSHDDDCCCPPRVALHVPACIWAPVQFAFCRPFSSVEGVASTLEVVCQGRLNPLALSVVSPLGDWAPFAQQQESVYWAPPKTFLLPPPHPSTTHPFYKLCFIM